MHYREIVSALLSRNGLEKPDGRALYAYRVTDREQELLAESLAHEFRNQTELKGDLACAAFCLFAAEWFCRTHETGTWKWDGIFADGLCLSGEAFQRANALNSRSELTHRGLLWWKLETIKLANSTRYLASLVCQGGLPLRALKRHSSSLGRFFKAVLRNMERFPTSEPKDLVMNELHLLAASLRNDFVIDLTLDLLTSVVRLRRLGTSDEVDGKSRREGLDKRNPKWRESIPLRVDDPHSEELLLGLLDQSTPEDTPVLPRVESLLSRLRDGAFCLTRKLVGPSEISSAAVAEFLSCTDRDLQGSMTLFLKSGLARQVAGRLRRTRSEGNWSLSTDGLPLAGSNCVSEIQVEAVSGSRPPIFVAVRGGENLDAAVPWVFAVSSDGLVGPGELIGTGSVRTTREQVLVRLPCDVKVSDLQPLKSIEHAGNLLGADVVLLNGELRVVSGGETYMIRCRERANLAEELTAHGARCQLGVNGNHVFLGPPKLSKWMSDGRVCPISAHSVQVWHGDTNGLRHRSRSEDTFGRVTYRMIADGEVTAQYRCIVLPVDFRFKIKAKAGELHLTSKDLACVQPEASEEIESRVVLKGVWWIVSVKVITDHAPRFVRVQLQFRNGDTVVIKCTCPCKEVRLIDLGGVQLRGDLSIEEFDYRTLQVVSSDRGTPGVFLKKPNIFLAHMRPVGEVSDHGCFELPLSVVRSRVEAILSTSDSLDECVYLEVRQGSAGQALKTFRVHQFIALLKPVYSDPAIGEEAFADLAIPSEVMKGLGLEHRQLTFELMAISDLSQPVDEYVSETGCGAWRIAIGRLPPGPYLATIFVDSHRCLRPVLINSQGSQPADVPGIPVPPSFSKVMKVVDRDERRQLLDSSVSRISDRPLSEEWGQIERLVEASRIRPMATFDAVVAVARSPFAAVVLSIHMGKYAWFWERMERLPFLWAAVPISRWVAVGSNLWDNLTETQTQSTVERHFRAFVSDWLGENSALPAHLRCVRAVVHRVFRLQGLPVASKDDSQLLATPHLYADVKRKVEELRSNLILRFTGDMSDTRDIWPNLPLTNIRAAMKEFADLPGIWGDVSQYHDNQLGMLNAPLYAVYCSVFDVTVTDEDRRVLQQFRGVDPEYFDSCFEHCCFLLAAKRLATAPDCFGASVLRGNA